MQRLLRATKTRLWERILAARDFENFTFSYNTLDVSLLAEFLSRGSRDGSNGRNDKLRIPAE